MVDTFHCQDGVTILSQNKVLLQFKQNYETLADTITHCIRLYIG